MRLGAQPIRTTCAQWEAERASSRKLQRAQSSRGAHLQSEVAASGERTCVPPPKHLCGLPTFATRMSRKRNDSFSQINSTAGRGGRRGELGLLRDSRVPRAGSPRTEWGIVLPPHPLLRVPHPLLRVQEPRFGRGVSSPEAVAAGSRAWAPRRHHAPRLAA